MIGICVECDEHSEFEEDLDVDEVIVFHKCQTRFEIIDLDPVKLDYDEKK